MFNVIVHCYLILRCEVKIAAFCNIVLGVSFGVHTIHVVKKTATFCKTLLTCQAKMVTTTTSNCLLEEELTVTVSSFALRLRGKDKSSWLH